MLWILVILAMASSVFGQDPYRCFSRFANCDIIYTKPYSKQWRKDNTQCLVLCAQDQPKCKGVVYDVTYSICNLYPFTGNSGPGFLIPAFKKIYYQVNDTNCLTGVTGLPVSGTTPIVIIPGGPIPADFGSQTSSGLTTLPTLAPLAARARFNFANNASAACPGDKQPVYLGLMETSVITPDDIDEGPTVSNIGDPSTCIKACTQNQVPNGRPMDCQSFTYNSVNQKCTFHPFNPVPEGSAETSTIVGMNTFVKSCVSVIPENQKCKNAMLVTVPRVELFGHVTKSIGNVESMVSCLERCLTATACKSFNYYPKIKKCTLHDTDSLATPDAIRAAKTEDAIYVENSCGAGSSRRQLAHVESGAVNRFESPTTPKPDDIHPLNLPKDNKSPKSKKIVNEKPAPSSAEDEAKFSSWGDWTECLKKAHGLNVRVRVRSCKDEKVVCVGKKAEYQKCDL